MIEAIAIMGGLGVVIGLGLAVASKIFYVYVDPKILAVDDALPGANCGGCGYPGCTANAEAIVAGVSPPTSCVAGPIELAEEIAGIIGASIEAKEPDIARPGCYFGTAKADLKYVYDGLNDCRAAALLSGGMKVCTIGCLGLGTCKQVCPFNAIVMGPQGLPIVDEVKCTGCGTCERVCPKHIINLSSTTRRILREYTTDECTTPCQRACPAGIDIREYIHQIERGDHHRAVQVIKERNPFPAVIGRICPRPCELECRRNYIDEPVAINYLKRYAADFERESGKRILPYQAPDTNRQVAVIGGGVEGLSTAFFAARLGHSATVYEATDRLGGLLNSAISTFRLPPDILEWDIQGIQAMGVKTELQQELGKDFTISSLLSKQYAAVFLATGGWDSRLARSAAKAIEKPVPGVMLLFDFMHLYQADAAKVELSSDIMIVGGGKLALEAAATCKKAGAENVTIILRESFENVPFNDTDIEATGCEGVQIIHNAAVHRLFGENDTLTAIEYIDMASASIHSLSVQTLILAAGRYPELIFSSDKPELPDAENEGTAATEEGVKWIATQPYKQPIFADQAGFFSKGEAISDYSAAIKAIGAGRRAAVSIHQIMYDIDELPMLPDHTINPNSLVQNVDHVDNVAVSCRQIMPLNTSVELTGKELENGFTKDMAASEASRCLQCGLICYERSSVEKKPQESVATA